MVNNPPGMNFGVQTPDVWIQPENSIIFEVKEDNKFISKTMHLIIFPVGQGVRISEQRFIRNSLRIKISKNRIGANG